MTFGTAGGNGSSGGSGSSGGPKPTPTTKPRPPVKATPKPSFEGLGTIPDSPHIGTALHLPPAPGQVIFVLDIANATRAQFWLAPTGTAVSDKALWLGEDRNGRNGWTARWRYTEEVPLAHLVVRATGPGGTAEEFFPVTNNGGMDPTEEVAEEVTEEQKPDLTRPAAGTGPRRPPRPAAIADPGTGGPAARPQRPRRPPRRPA